MTSKPMTSRPKPVVVAAAPSTFSSRRADREAAPAPAPKRRTGGFRAGVNAENPLLVVTNVRA